MGLPSSINVWLGNFAPTFKESWNLFFWSWMNLPQWVGAKSSIYLSDEIRLALAMRDVAKHRVWMTATAFDEHHIQGFIYMFSVIVDVAFSSFITCSAELTYFAFFIRFLLHMCTSFCFDLSISSNWWRPFPLKYLQCECIIIARLPSILRCASHGVGLWHGVEFDRRYRAFLLALICLTSSVGCWIQVGTTTSSALLDLLWTFSAHF